MGTMTLPGRPRTLQVDAVAAVRDQVGSLGVDVSAMSERIRLLSQGDVSSGAVPQQEGGRGAPSQHKKIEPLDLGPKGTEWHQMSPEVGEKQECVEVGGYGEDWPEPTRWPDPGWGPASTSAILQRIIRTSTSWKLGAAERLSGPQANPRRTLGVGVGASKTSSKSLALAGSFGQFFRLRMQQVLERYHTRRQATSVEEPVPLIPEQNREFETRLGIMLTKNLPATIRQPVMERDHGRNIWCLHCFCWKWSWNVFRDDILATALASFAYSWDIQRIVEYHQQV